jgi:hypothetical protein
MGYVVLGLWSAIALGIMLVGWVTLMLSPSSGFIHAFAYWITVGAGAALLLVVAFGILATVLNKMG